jgi:hypothetical protein
MVKELDQLGTFKVIVDSDFMEIIQACKSETGLWSPYSLPFFSFSISFVAALTDSRPRVGRTEEDTFFTQIIKLPDPSIW